MSRGPLCATAVTCSSLCDLLSFLCPLHPSSAIISGSHAPFFVALSVDGGGGGGQLQTDRACERVQCLERTLNALLCDAFRAAVSARNASGNGNMHWAVSQNMWNKTHQRRPRRAMSLATVRVCPIRSRQFATPGIERGISLAEATVSSRQPDIGGRRRGIQKSVRARTAPRSAGSAGLALAQHLDDTPLQLCPHRFVPRGLLLFAHPLHLPVPGWMIFFPCLTLDFDLIVQRHQPRRARRSLTRLVPRAPSRGHCECRVYVGVPADPPCLAGMKSVMSPSVGFGRTNVLSLSTRAMRLKHHCVPACAPLLCDVHVLPCVLAVLSLCDDACMLPAR